ncbi:Uncharacterised protein [Anaerobiospirillum thomasii]|uniref:hypothetical protein n=1 Tax=Anaerobiospirillum thomasii TaxID=179995 RepID=UPI000D9EE4CF|nr:hypothetical protein [Anaerobiospirillum thomasii]SPT68103.1 Uncharacterised protein [Anaerobiospirillum thomasii]
MSDSKDVCCACADEREDMVKESKDCATDMTEDRVDAIIRTVDKILQLLLDIDKAYKEGIEFNHEFLYKILRPTFVQAENMLPDLRDLCDDLQIREDARSQKLNALVLKLEDAIEPLLPLLESLHKGDK